jgi:predicted AAA+ superfamily ATPase
MKKNITLPGDPLPFNSCFYIERPPIESDAYAELLKPGSLIRIKAPRQMGKSLVSVSGDRTAIIWNLPQIFATNDLDYACNWVKDYLQNNQELENSEENNSSGDKLSTRHLCDH